MKGANRRLAVVAVVAALGLAGCLQGNSTPQQLTAEQMVARGRHLITVGDCSICHSPKVMTDRGPMVDSSMLLAGHRAEAPVLPFPADVLASGVWGTVANPEFTAWAGPWGISFAPNLTPDKFTGSGAWTEQQFIDAMRTGKHLGVGRPILPPMPWEANAAHTDDDLKAIFAYLQSIKPVENLVPQPVPPLQLGQTEPGQ
jgi:mono/diheme cytochrome c family protein